ncbi:hypothetical protein [Subtercola frigoramans]|uniref:DUF1206 domain-containing protein n=1 Tax=Subtercola frigoramans TaxID=120298 RepID=A0ABS2L0L1_9MICO|nr:hypothetical protein [Subtercola frigoramans]MBM7470603.1 hypothetical protein [Subtercola frigoramans]
MNSTGVRSAASRAGHSRALTVLARVGFAISGLIHILIGYFSIPVALNQSAEDDQSGALTEVA